MDIVHMVVVGLVATVTLDAWQQFFRLLFGMPATNWAMIARWFGHMPQGQFVQQDIGKAASVPHEGPLGCVLHYIVATGLAIIYPLLMRFVFGSPSGFLSAMVYDIATICITWFFIEPALGVGTDFARTPVMASKTPSPQ